MKVSSSGVTVYLVRVIVVPCGIAVAIPTSRVTPVSVTLAIPALTSPPPVNVSVSRISVVSFRVIVVNPADAGVKTVGVRTV